MNDIFKKYYIPIRNLVFVLAILGITACSHYKDPNIVLIVVDDLGYADIGCAGLASDVQTPNIDLLAKAGVRFTQAYATSPICNPSRAGIITGSYQERWGTFWYGGDGLHDPSFSTIAEIVKEKEYKTAYIGKVHYGGHDTDTTHRSFPLNHGFDYFFGFTSARKHYLIHHQEYEESFQKSKKKNERKGQSLRQQGLWENTNTIDTLAFSTEMFGKKACEFIQAHKQEKFFLQLSFNAVHNFTHQLPEEYLKEKGLHGYSDWDPSHEGYYEWYKQGRYPNNPEGRAHYLGQLYYLDQAIGTVMDCLKENGLKENTVVIFISDNGGSTPIYANNFPLRGSKYLLYEGGIRVPMILAYPPKYRKGKVSENVVSAMDILPTICRALNINAPDYINGKDLSMLLTGADTTINHDTLVWDTHQEVAVRAGKWKYHMAKKDGHAKYEMVELELGEHLYNLEADPGETTNLAEDYPEILSDLKRAHQHWLDEIIKGDIPAN